MITNLKPGLYVGIDTGATTTEATITKESGFVLGVGRSGSANIHNVSCDEACSNVKKAIDNAVADAKEKNPEIDIKGFEVLCVGLSGLDTDLDRKKLYDHYQTMSLGERTFGAKKMIIANNGLVGLMSGTDEPFGVCLIAATGANCYGLSRIGKESMAGHWGYLLGDQGSAYALGRAILQQVMKEYDGRSPKTMITQKVLEFLKLTDPSEVVDWAYNNGDLSIKNIASLSQLCDENTMPDAVEIADMVNNAVKELTLAYRAVINRLGLADSSVEIPVILVGGLFKMKGQFSMKVKRSLLNITPKAKIIVQTRSVSEGAALLARMHEQIKIFPESLVVIMKPED